ncbi:intermembrane lipid transfer protein Vps13D isoform X2 [Eupeodes corollae]|uniref:intermembrane lipid transfer protein Vps13D isoform X2 n=1 Tax=Eupeodes corollae TaxID=290404 RepID=UPI0024928CEA|nr:intermembrane lipid transfer protein Vps13D isoform X2 [Eupeodes corollae]
MLRELITWVLNTYLGKYLEDFNPAQLSVALLSGEVELENVPIRKDSLRSFGLPLQAISGNIGKIKLQIPVRQFRTAPWCIIIEGVHAVIGPKDLNDWDDEKEKQSDLEYKLCQLDDAEAKWRAAKGDSCESNYYASSYSSWLSYGTGLATNICENLQLKINGVHIRYEDSITIPDFSFVTGITIESLTAHTCDANWQQNSTTSWNQEVAFKLVELKAFAIYWDRLFPENTCRDIQSSELSNSMEIVCSTREHRYIISPISAKAHCRHDRSPLPLRTRNRPRLSCEVNVTEVNICLSDFQYTQMVDCVRGLQAISKIRAYRVLRPSNSVRGHTKDWWLYAVRCHGFFFETTNEKWSKAKENIRYIKMYTKVLLNPNENLSPEDKQFKFDVEKSRDLDDLRTLREVCFLQLVTSELDLKGQDCNQGRSMLFQWFPNWWGWYGNSGAASPASENSGGELLPSSDSSHTLEDDILNALEGSVENNSLLKRDAVFGKFDFSLTGGQLNVCSENFTNAEVKPMMEMNFDNLNLNIETRPRSGSHLIGLSLGSVCVKDLFTPNTEFPELIKPQMKDDPLVPPAFSRFQNVKGKKDTEATTDDNNEPWFLLQYEKKPLAFNTDYRLAVKTRCLDVVYNMEALKWLTDFFTGPLQNANARRRLERMKYSTKMRLIKNWKSIIEGDLGQRKSWCLEIDVSAPQIIFVENFTKKNTSIVLVDFGRFQLSKNSTDNRIRQQNSLKSEQASAGVEQINGQVFNFESEEDEAFMTPCSTPPGSENSPSDSTTLLSAVPDLSDIVINNDTGLEDALHDKIYDKYTIDMTDLQVLVCKGKERWGFASVKGSSALHLLDRFSISLQLERRVVHTVDPEYPSLTLFGTLPKLVAHVNEHKVSALMDILAIISADSSTPTPEAHPSPANISDHSSTFHLDDDSISLDESANTTEQQQQQMNLIMLQFVIDQMSLEVQSRGRSIAELQVSGVRAGLSKRPEDTNISLSVHGLLLVDAIQSFGPDFELLVASHRHVGMDSVSGSLKQSEPCSPTSPASPDPLDNRRPTSPLTISKAISSLQRDALITLEINFINSTPDTEPLQIANINFNNLDIIANQETIVELLGFVNRVVPNKKPTKSSTTAALVSQTGSATPAPARPTSIDLNRRHQLQRQFTETRLGGGGATTNAITSIRTEITFDFHRLNILVLRALKRDSYLVGRKVGTFTMSEAKIHATLGQEISVNGSLGGLQILDLTPEGINHQRIFSVGKDPLTDPPDMRQDLLNSLTQEVYGYSGGGGGGYGMGKDKMIDQRQALSFNVSRDVTATVSVKIRMASVWYTHCARFVQEISWCAKEFKHYLKNFARSIREKATDMAIGLVQPLNDPVEIFIDTPLNEKQPRLFASPHKVKKGGKKVKIKLDIILDTPVLVVPRSSCSAQVLVAHLGKITVTNNQEELRSPPTYSLDNYTNEDDEEIFTIDEVDFQRNEPQIANKTNVGEIVRLCDKYSIEIRNMNLFSLDTSRRKGFRLSALPRAEEFYSCATDAVAILHDTVIQLEVKKFAIEDYTITSTGYSQEQRDDDDLLIDGSVTQPLQISLSRRQYEQLLETLDNVFKIPNDLVRPPAEVSVDTMHLESDNNSSPFELNNRLPEKMFHSEKPDNQHKELTPKISFSLPIFIIQLKNEHDNPLIEITFREFSVQYDQASQYETVVQVMLRSILMEDLKCPIDSKYRQMVVSSAQEDRTCRPVNAPSSSCPDLVRVALNNDMPTGSLPENLESSAGFDCNSSAAAPTTTLNAINYHRSRLQVNAGADCPGTPPPSPQSKAHEDNLVIYSALLIDPKCPTLATNYQNRRQTSSIDFNCLNLIISVERWFMVLDFFGLVSDDEDENTPKDGAEEQIDEVHSNGNSELEITVRSLNLVFVRNESELAKANVSNAFFVVAKYDLTKTVEGRLGSVSLYDLTNYGKIYREKFLTSGSEALKFIYKRQDEKGDQRSLSKDATLKIQMSSVRYVHTKRFVMEIQAFIKEFLQLQTPVMKKIKLSDRAPNAQQRPTQLGLEISAGSPIVLLPLSFESNRMIVADLGEFTLSNSFHLASESHVISKKSDQALMDEILDVMQIHLVNTNLFTGDRVSKSQELQRNENDADICLDMGSFWALKTGNSIFKEKCHLKLQVERNMDSGSSHNCPDVSVQGTLSRLSGVLNLQQYKLVRGFLAYNLGENIDDIYNNYSFSLAESRMNITSMEQVQQLTIPDKIVWNNLSINLDLEDVSVLLNSRSDDRQHEDQPLACINFIKSWLKIDSYSDASQDIDLVSQEILITDSRFQRSSREAPKNVFTNILQPIRAEVGSNIVQAEVHSRQRKDHSKFTILLNNMRVMAILDWIENLQDYLSQDADPPSGAIMRMKNTGASMSSSTLDETDKIPMEVILNITDSELVFVEKTDQYDTNAIILKSTTVFSFKPMDLIRPISVNLNHLEVFSCMLGFENETALSIIDPITVNLDLRENTIDIQIQKQLCIRLSYHDVKMFIRMIESLPKQTRTAQKKRTALHRESVYSLPDAELIAPLMAMGFKRADCIRALEMCKNQLNEAALWLTQQRATRQPTMEVHSVVVNAQCISVCVIDDCMDADVPLLELSLSQLKFNQLLNERLASLTSQYNPLRIPVFCSGQLEAVIASDYYNRHLSGWEPVIEPWECTANWNYSTGQTSNESNLLNLSIMSKQMLKVNITTTLIELWQLVRNNWTQDYYEGTNNAIATSTTSANDCPINYRRRAPFVPFSLKNDTGQVLSFKILLTQPGGITRTEVTSHNMISEWIQVQPYETVPFGFGPQTKLRHLDSHKLNLHQILVQVKGWAQVGPVSIDRVGIFFRHALQDDSPSEKARIVFDVSLVGSAQKLITVRSALRLINRLDNKILLKLDQETAVVEPSKCFSVPLSRVRSDLFFMPMFELTPDDERNGNALERVKDAPRDSNLNHQLNEYFFQQTLTTSRNGNRHFGLCDEGISWSKCIEDIIQEPRICRANRDKVYNVVTTIKRDGYPHRDGVPGHTIMLIPPLRITNLLCCDLLYKISGQVQDKTTSHTQGRITSSTTANIYEVSLEEAISLSITLDNYKVSGQLKIPVGHTGVVEPKLKLLDINNRDLHLRASIQAIKGNGMEIFISAPFWLVNRTGLPLVFRQEGVSQPASGQFEEHEMARVVTPLMFSFSDPEASPSLEIRLGERYGINNQWCQSFSLHKEIIYRQLKAANSNDSFAIGVEVRRGRGRYSRTSVVTFSPRFQLYNRSSRKLQFAQKCHVTKPVDLESRSTYIDAVPGCHFPFHWPRSDQEPLLCVRMADVDCCHWSSGIPINEAQSLYINIRNDMGDMRFLRLEVILQGSTYFLLFGDAHALPPPIRLDNFSEVPIKFFQYGCKPEWRTTVRPSSSLSYALDDPIGHQLLQIEAPGGNSIEIPLRNLSCSEGLTYSNFIYLAFKGTFQTPSVSEHLYLSSEFDIESQHLVLGVKNSKVILMRKHAGDRSQLWLMNKLGQLEHEGSSPPSEPGRSSAYSVTRMVLDLEKAPNPNDYTNLCVRAPNTQRQTTQTWKFENGRLMCHANMCVQARNGVFGLRPGSDAVLGRIESETRTLSDVLVPIEQNIERQKLRPGSGQLDVKIRMDGPIKTIQIVDVKNPLSNSLTPDPQWKHASAVKIKSNRGFREKDQKSHFVDELSVKVDLEKGIGISVISRQPCEELTYITLQNITIEALATPSVRSIDFGVNTLQIDNQLLDTPCPILLYTIKPNISSSSPAPSMAIESGNPNALTFNARVLSSPNKNAVIVEYLKFDLRPCVVYLEERLILKMAMFLGLGSSHHSATSLADESEYEAQQVEKRILASNAKRYYFENLQIHSTHIRLSVITASKLSPQLSEMKRKLGLTMIKFEDALIEFDYFTDRHHFETLEMYMRAIKSHYKNQIKWHAAYILGCVDFLGNPLGFANDLSEGVSGLIFEGSVKSLVKNVTHGISNSTAKLTETISDGLGRVVLNEQDTETRQRILEVPTGSNTSGEHLAAGLKGLGFGLLGGVTSIVRHTYEGAQNDGFQGFISGLGKGIVGTVTKPIIGVLDLASETASAVRETSKSAHRVLPERKRPPRCVTGAPGGLLPPYSYRQAKGQQYLYLINRRNFSEQLMSYEQDLCNDRDAKLRLLVSTEYLRLFSRNEEEPTVMLECHLDEVLSCHPVTAQSSHNSKAKPHYYIEISKNLGQIGRPRVRCQSEEMAEKAARCINYAKSVYDEREHTLSYQSSLNES